jgi:hypothetical protein
LAESSSEHDADAELALHDDDDDGLAPIELELTPNTAASAWIKSFPAWSAIFPWPPANLDYRRLCHGRR